MKLYIETLLTIGRRMQLRVSWKEFSKLVSSLKGHRSSTRTTRFYLLLEHMVEPEIVKTIEKYDNNIQHPYCELIPMNIPTEPRFIP